MEQSKAIRSVAVSRLLDDHEEFGVKMQRARVTMMSRGRQKRWWRLHRAV